MNQFIKSRLEGIYSVLCSAFEAGKLLSSASKGYEREAFISLFLSEVLPPIYRFGTGDITDSQKENGSNKISGQIDIVIEMPWTPSFPMPIGTGARLYPSEAVGAALEIKSNISTQWDEVIGTANKLDPLLQKLSGISVVDGSLNILGGTEEKVPFYAVGYDGWTTISKVEEKIRGAAVDGIFILKHKIFVCSDRRKYSQRLLKCKEELKNKNQGDAFDMTQAACARVVELTSDDTPSIEAVKILNKEKYAINAIRFEGTNSLPKVDIGAWTEQDLLEVQNVFQLKTYVAMETDAILQFISRVHEEVGKRAAMNMDILTYA